MLMSLVPLTLENTVIKQVMETKCLGVLVDQHLSWKPHIDFVSQKILKSVGIIVKAHFYLSFQTLIGLTKPGRHFGKYPRIVRVTGANQKARKSLSTDLMITNRDYKTAIGDKTVETLYSDRVTTQITKESRPPSPLHSKLGCLFFSIGSSNCGITLHGGDGGGKALFPPLEVSKVSESPSRAKCPN